MTCNHEVRDSKIWEIISLSMKKIQTRTVISWFGIEKRHFSNFPIDFQPAPEGVTVTGSMKCTNGDWAMDYHRGWGLDDTLRNVYNVTTMDICCLAYSNPFFRAVTSINKELDCDSRGADFSFFSFLFASDRPVRVGRNWIGECMCNPSVARVNQH